MYIEMQSTVTYWFKWLDTSQISLFDFGLARRDYKVERQSGNKAGNAGHEQPVLRSICYQARRITQVEWSIASIDVILGLVGGVSGIIWAGLGLILAPYEDFKFQNSIIGMVYPTAPLPDASEPIADSRRKAKE